MIVKELLQSRYITVINGLKLILTWFDRLTMTGHPKLVEGCTDYYETINNVRSAGHDDLL